MYTSVLGHTVDIDGAAVMMIVSVWPMVPSPIAEYRERVVLVVIHFFWRSVKFSL